MVAKQRITVTNPQVWEFLEYGIADEGNADFRQAFLSPIAYQIWRLGLGPRIMTQYRRKAYFGRNEPYTRVTFDRSLRCYPETTYNPFPREEKFANYDNIDVYKSPTSNIILELKCELKVPLWMRDLVRRFGLKHSSFSKFDSSYTFASDKLTSVGL